MSFPDGAAAVRHTDLAVETSIQGNVGCLVNFNGGTPVDAADTFTETYATAARTIPAATYSVYTVTTVATAVTKTNSSPYGFSSGDADKVVTALAAIPTDLAGMQVEIAALAADVLALKKLIVALVQDGKANGLIKTA
jgi:hypothetical protein